MIKLLTKGYCNAQGTKVRNDFSKLIRPFVERHVNKNVHRKQLEKILWAVSLSEIAFATVDKVMADAEKRRVQKAQKKKKTRKT